MSKNRRLTRLRYCDWWGDAIGQSLAVTQAGRRSQPRWSIGQRGRSWQSPAAHLRNESMKAGFLA
jgi:hypothetical protein